MKRDDTQSCPEIRDRIPLYVGGDLDPEALESVRTHLDDCEACARIAGDASRARQVFLTSFRGREAALPRPDLWAGIRVALHEEGILSPARPSERAPVSPPRGAEASRPRLRLVRYAGGLAAAAAVVIFASLSLLQGPRTVEVVDGPPVPLAIQQPEDVSTTGLTRVAPGEEGLIDSALELRYAQHPRLHPSAPGVPLKPELASYK